MITALDSSIILDVLTADPRFADSAEQLLRRAFAEGRLVIGECVAAEILPAFKAKEKFLGFPARLADRLRPELTRAAAFWPARISPNTSNEEARLGVCCRIS